LRVGVEVRGRQPTACPALSSTRTTPSQWRTRPTGHASHERRPAARPVAGTDPSSPRTPRAGLTPHSSRPETRTRHAQGVLRVDRQLGGGRCKGLPQDDEPECQVSVGRCGGVRWCFVCTWWCLCVRLRVCVVCVDVWLRTCGVRCKGAGWLVGWLAGSVAGGASSSRDGPPHPAHSPRLARAPPCRPSAGGHRSVERPHAARRPHASLLSPRHAHATRTGGAPS